jgi:hypothetical protein
VINSPATLVPALRTFVTQFPEKVLFGTDAFGGGPDAGWELAAWIGTNTARQALASPSYLLSRMRGSAPGATPIRHLHHPY